jgi:hypothetical protein
MTGEADLAVWDGNLLKLPLSIACLHRRKYELMLQTLLPVLSKFW